MSSETALRGAVKRALAPYARVVRVENACEPGTPDVYYRLRTGEAGWLELKQTDDWPARPKTCLLIRSLTLEQVMWIEAETRAGGTAHALLQVATKRLLLDAELVRGLFERQLTRAALLDRAAEVGDRRLDPRRLVAALRGCFNPASVLV